MSKIIFRQKAIDDLNSIWEYTIEMWTEKQADVYYAKIKMACYMIAENPELGRVYEEIGGNLYGLKSGKHIIFYRPISNSRIEIIRVLHERMDLKNRIIK